MQCLYHKSNLKLNLNAHRSCYAYNIEILHTCITYKKNNLIFIARALPITFINSLTYCLCLACNIIVILIDIAHALPTYALLPTSNCLLL